MESRLVDQFGWTLNRRKVALSRALKRARYSEDSDSEDEDSHKRFSIRDFVDYVNSLPPRENSYTNIKKEEDS